MRQTLITLSALLLAVAILYTGNGLQNTLLAVRANLEGFSVTATGLLFAVYSAGFILGCQWTPTLVNRVGHIRSFTALASVASASALCHALLVEEGVWMFFRGITGFCFAGLYMIVESWINEKASNENRGKVLGAYRLVDAAALMAGQMLLSIADPAGFALFALLSVLISLSLVPVALTTSVAPQPVHGAKLNVRKLWKVSPLAAMGCLGVGAANGAFWGVAPVYVLRSGYGAETVALFMTVFIFAGALSQYPVGLLSDHIDRRKVIVGTSALAAVAGSLVIALGAGSVTQLLLAGACFGLFAMPLFGLCAAHANDHAEAHEYVETNGGLLLLYGVGAVAGPILAPLLMDWLGSWSLFAFTAGVHTLMTVFGLFRLHQRGDVAAEDKEAFVAMPETTPMVFEMDPRAHEDEEELPSAQ